VIGSTVSYRLRSFTLKNVANDGYGVLATDLQLHGLSIDVTQATPPLLQSRPAGITPPPPSFLLPLQLSPSGLPLPFSHNI